MTNKERRQQLADLLIVRGREMVGLVREFIKECGLREQDVMNNFDMHWWSEHDLIEVQAYKYTNDKTAHLYLFDSMAFGSDVDHGPHKWQEFVGDEKEGDEA